MPEGTHPALDRAAFDGVVAAADPAMCVVTTVGTADRADERSGCLVGFHCQCGIDPPRYAVWVSTANHTAGVVTTAEHVAVHLLGPDQHDLAELFGATTGDEIDKFAVLPDGAWTTGPGGLPLLAGCRGRIVLRVVERVETDADHLCVVGEPVDAELAPQRPGSAGEGVLRLSAVADIDAAH